MPKYEVEYSDGRTYEVESDTVLTDEQILSYVTDPYNTPDMTVEAFTQSMTPRNIDEEETNKMEAVESFKQDDVTYNVLKGNKLVQDAAMRFAKERLDTDIKEDDAIDEVIEHFRSFDVNEITAARDFNYVSGLVSDKKETELNDFKLLYSAYDSLPNFYADGAAPGAVGDYVKGLATAPSTYIGLLLPAGGKVAGQAGVQTSKLAIGKLLNTMASNPIKSAIAVEAIGGSLQNIAAQKTFLEADMQKNYSVAETGVVAALSAAPVALIPFFAKKGLVGFIEKDTGDLTTISVDAVKKNIEEANKKTDTLLKVKKNEDAFLDISTALGNISIKGTEQPFKADADILNNAIASTFPKSKKAPLDKGKVQKGKEIVEDIGVTELELSTQKFKNLIGGLTEITGGLRTIDGKKERITEAIARSFKNKKNIKGFENVLDKYNLTTDDFANVFMYEVSDAARLLQSVGQFKKQVSSGDSLMDTSKLLNNLSAVADNDFFDFSLQAKKGILEANELAKKGDVREYLAKSPLTKEPQTMGQNIGSGLRNLDAARLAFMTSQVGTTVRNTVSGYTRVGFDVLTKSIDNGIQQVTGTAPLKANSDTFSVFMGLANRAESKAVREIFQTGFGKEASKLFRELADIPVSANGKVSRLHGVSRQINALNTISDNMFKSAALTGNLKRQLNLMYTKAVREGSDKTADDFNLINILKEGKFNKVFSGKEGKEALKTAIEESLYFTYQRSPQNATARAFTRMVHAVPFVGTQVIPFPRFMMNAMRFTYEYSPLNMAMYGDILNATADTAGRIAGREAVDPRRSYENAAKGMVGMAALAGATAFRLSENAGPEWYNGVYDSGETYDLRPMFPAAPYLFFGDLIARHIREEPTIKNKRAIQDAIQAVSGAQFKTGSQLYILENGIEDLVSGDPEKVQKMVSEFAGNLLSTFTIPATVAQDTYNTFFAPDDERQIRDNNSKDVMSFLINKTLARVPANFAMETYLEKTLGEDVYKAPSPLVSSTSTGVKRRVTPVIRQTAGLLTREKRNEFETEIERLKILPSNVYRRTRDPEVDAIHNSILNIEIEKIIPYINSDKYKNIRDMRNELKRLGEDAKEIRGLSKIELQRKMLLNRITIAKTKTTEDVKKRSKGIVGNPIERRAFEKYDDTVQSLTMNRYHKNIGIPNEENGEAYNYEVLLSMAKEISSTLSNKNLDLSQTAQ